MRTALHLEQGVAGPSARTECPCLGLTRPRCFTRISGSAYAHVVQKSIGRLSTAASRHMLVVKAAAETEAQAAQTGSEQKGEELYEVNLSKPLGIRFGRGTKDGMAYVTSVDEKKGNIDERVEVGDKLVEVSASFGDDIWEAGNFGQTMYAIKTRNGDLYFKFKKMNGDLSAFEEESVSDTEKRFRRERSGGNYGGGTKELQLQNFKAKQEREAKRKSLFNSGLDKFNKKDIQGALYDFEEVIAMEQRQPTTPREYSLVSSLYRVSHYNIACCYAAIDQPEAGLEALDICLQAGFDQFGKIRTDPNLEKLRQSPKFTPLIERYDEPVIDTNILKSIKGLFGGKKD